MTTNKIPHTTDAKIWADEFVRSARAHPHTARDHGCMVSWFANALMAGHDGAVNHFRRKSLWERLWYAWKGMSW